jgi:hypothetical protein
LGPQTPFVEDVKKFCHCSSWKNIDSLHIPNGFNKFNMREYKPKRNKNGKHALFLSLSASAWNSIDDRKYNQNQKLFLKELRSDLLAGLDV